VVLELGGVAQQCLIAADAEALRRKVELVLDWLGRSRSGSESKFDAVGSRWL
jgi:hypothetical protein